MAKYYIILLALACGVAYFVYTTGMQAVSGLQNGLHMAGF